MNYIRLINAFYDRLETSQLSTSAIALWHALANVNNKAGWLREFAVAVSVLCIKTGLSERTITNARNDLKMKGFIDFRSRKGSKSAVYQLYDLSAMITYKVSEKSLLSATDADNLSGYASDNLSDKPSDNASALVVSETKQNETKQTTAVSRQHWFDEYYQCFGKQPNALQCQNITVYLEQDGLEDAVICKAFRMSAELGKPYGYSVGILNNWAAKGIKTLADVEQEQKHFQARRQQGQRASNPQRREVEPEWMKKQEQDKPPEDPEEVKRRAKEIEEYLNSI
ncbi:DnaD domain protein [Sporolactobacillus laevolacticus]|uniref:DNA damage-indicible protein DnaD n=1 Tax=Sporolactobacillus laevolacticus DSM 442 TaxID=1395513 RepID=V6IXM6_9BACL|nr:DnaD domain protein [Sporolactobacillus laevolacticus]EST12065.1 DNA damage-indicible protein DnaD [Sporolactobacillus laevolacticus DSM 442]